MGIPNPTTNKLEAHNCWLVSIANLGSRALANTNKADVVKDYIEWAVQKNYAVIDVNIPKYVTTEAVSWVPPLAIVSLLTYCFKVSWKIRRRRREPPFSYGRTCGLPLGQLYRVCMDVKFDMGRKLILSDRPNEATEIFFLGVGDAFYGVANLLINRGMFRLLFFSLYFLFRDGI